jgi:hypothetical protein
MLLFWGCLLDVMFETLTCIFLLPDRESQKSALHGLAHLYHPEVRDAVQEFIDTNKSDFSLKWLEQCRDCDLMRLHHPRQCLVC